MVYDRSAACKLSPLPCRSSKAARMACLKTSTLMMQAAILAAVPGHTQVLAAYSAPLSAANHPSALLQVHWPASCTGWCSTRAACVACPHSPSALPQVAVQLLRLLSSQAAHLRGLSEELAVQHWLAEVDGRTGPDAVPAQASLWGCCSWPTAGSSTALPVPVGLWSGQGCTPGLCAAPCTLSGTDLCH